MSSWLWSSWLQVWPNLAANVLWIPIVGISHLLTKRHVTAAAEAHRKQLADHVEQLQQQLSDHHDRLVLALGAAPTTEEV